MKFGTALDKQEFFEALLPHSPGQKFQKKLLP
jgi:hypothetical protein